MIPSHSLPTAEFIVAPRLLAAVPGGEAAAAAVAFALLFVIFGLGRRPTGGCGGCSGGECERGTCMLEPPAAPGAEE